MHISTSDIPKTYIFFTAFFTTFSISIILLTVFSSLGLNTLTLTSATVSSLGGALVVGVTMVYLYKDRCNDIIQRNQGIMEH
jgi:hypothetical protein